MTKCFYLMVLAMMALGLSSCNTFIGMGRDFQSLGNGMVNKGHGKNWDGSPAPARRAPAPAPAPAAR